MVKATHRSGREDFKIWGTEDSDLLLKKPYISLSFMKNRGRIRLPSPPKHISLKPKSNNNISKFKPIIIFKQ